MEIATTTPTLLRRKEVETKTGLRRSAIYELIQEGKFPAQVKLGIGRCVAWVESDIDQWIQDRIDSGRRILPKKPEATENFLRDQLGRGSMAEPILRNRADTYGIQWSDIEQVREDGLVVLEEVNGMTAARWSLT